MPPTDDFSATYASSSLLYCTMPCAITAAQYRHTPSASYSAPRLLAAKYASARVRNAFNSGLVTNRLSASNSLISGCCNLAPALALYCPILTYGIGFCVKPSSMATFGGAPTLIFISDVHHTTTVNPPAPHVSRCYTIVSPHLPATGSSFASSDSSDE